MGQEDAALLICGPINILLALGLPRLLGPAFHGVISPDSCSTQLPRQAPLKCFAWTGPSPRKSWMWGWKAESQKMELGDVGNKQEMEVKTGRDLL